MIVICSENHTEHISVFCEQNVEYFNVKPGGTYTNHQTLQGISTLLT
jgi:hypothetical protein